MISDNKYSFNWHRTFVRLTRDFSAIFPVPQEITFAEAQGVILECERSWRNHAHCENPYCNKDPRFDVWAEHTLVIFERVKSLCEQPECEIIDLKSRIKLKNGN